MRLTIKILTVVIVLLPLTELFLVCYSTFVDQSNYWHTIKIKEGNHSYYPSVRFIYDLKEIEFYIRANESWYYKEPERNGWSKLRGFSKGMHHDGGSARLVYKCVDDTLLLVGSYCYVNGVHPNDGTGQQATLDTIQPGKVYHCIIRHEDHKFKFWFEDVYWECEAGINPTWGYMLNPFIGGVYTLEHDWTIDILDIRKDKPEIDLETDSLQAFKPGF
ncbi:MAG: hypothetical protein K9H58_19000 [Bacteroidales bacterium]|nr:hypothetical protein [Bacteroidales bacterium]